MHFRGCKQTFNHIKGRCEIIKEEQRQNAANKEGTGEEEEEEALIQLKALDDNTELLVNIPQEGTKEYEIFTTKLPIEFQNAIKTESIDEVNKEFAKLKLKMLKEYWKFSMNVVLSVSVAI